MDILTEILKVVAGGIVGWLVAFLQYRPNKRYELRLEARKELRPTLVKLLDKFSLIAFWAEKQSDDPTIRRLLMSEVAAAASLGSTLNEINKRHDFLFMDQKETLARVAHLGYGLYECYTSSHIPEAETENALIARAEEAKKLIDTVLAKIEKM